MTMPDEVTAETVLRLLAYPFFIVIHILFTLSSFILRLAQSFHNPHPPTLHNESTQETKPPKHVAFSFPAKSSERGFLWPSIQQREGRALLESLRRIVVWSVEEGVQEVSVYSTLGWTEIRSDLDFLFLPIAFPTSHISGTETPPDSMPSPSYTRSSSSMVSSTTNTEGPDKRNGNGSGNGSNVAHHNELRYRRLSKKPQNPSKTIQYDIQLRNHSLKIHLLPPLDLSPITRRFAKSGIPPSHVSVTALDTEIRSESNAAPAVYWAVSNLFGTAVIYCLGITSDPDILIVHPLTPLNPIRALLARPAPELAGYPFWLLRVTEIYHHSPPLPLLRLFSPIVHSLRQSALPALKKIGHALPLVYWESVKGAIQREEWDGAMAALGFVEQRLGR